MTKMNVKKQYLTQFWTNRQSNRSKSRTELNTVRETIWFYIFERRSRRQEQTYEEEADYETLGIIMCFVTRDTSVLSIRS